MKVRLWVNQWFSTMYQIILQLKEGAHKDGMELYVIGSSRNKEAVYREVCDAFYEEPIFDNPEDYGAWCLAFCMTHGVNVFFPKKRMIQIARMKKQFLAKGIRVLVEDQVELMELLNDKLETASYFRHYLGSVCKVPDQEVVTNVKGFEEAYQHLKSLHQETNLCIKYVSDEGGVSFKKIVESPLNMGWLEMRGTHIPYEQLKLILASEKQFKPLLVMPYLNGEEISIDCVPTQEGLVAIPRIKGNGRVRIIDDAPCWQKKAQMFWQQTKLICPFNIQFRYHEEELYLLEVNTRMSGGVHYAYYAGINLPYIALRSLLGLNSYLPYPLNKQKLSYVEQPVILSSSKEPCDEKI